MPHKDKGKRKAISRTIRKEKKAGKSQDEAVAIALSKSERPNRRRKGPRFE